MQPVLHSFSYALNYLRDLVADIAPADMVAQPYGVANHPSWTIGHLTGSCQLLGEVAGLSWWLPADWAQRFGTGSVPVADVSVYEPKDEALTILGDSQTRLTQAVAQLDDAYLDQPFPQESLRAVFPTVRHALTHVMIGHTSNHIGQLIVWRRVLGLPPRPRSFE